MDLKILLLIVVAGVRGTDIKKIWCVDENTKNEKKIMKNIKKDEMLCKSEYIPLDTDYPWTYTEERTPTTPEQMMLKCRTYKTDIGNASVKQIAIDVSWRHRLSYLEHVDSYHLEINHLKPYFEISEQYIMKWNESLTTALSESSASYVEFHFFYNGNDRKYHIEPADMYQFTIQGMPIYDEKSDPQSVSSSITIPVSGCNDRKESKTELIGDLPELTMKVVKATTTTQGKSEGIPNYVFIVIGAILFLLLLVLIVVIGLCAYQRKLPSVTKEEIALQPQNKTILLISSNEEDIFSQSINKLINILKSNDRIQVRNIGRHTVEIAKQGSLKWMTKAVDNADFVIFLVCNEHACVSEELLGEGQEQHVFLKITENIIHSLNSSASKNHNKFLMVDLNKCVKKKDFPYFQYYDLPTNFRKFSKHLLGDFIIDEADRTIFINLLTNAQLGHGKKICHKNDLDIITNPSCILNSDSEVMPVTLNIDIDGPPSCESNSSQPYKTTDFNDLHTMHRYHQAGAIPKC